MLYDYRVVNIFLNGTLVRSRVNLVHFKGVQLDPYETYMILTCCTWDCLWNMGHTAGTLRKIGIYFILRNNWHIYVPWNISKIFYWISFFFCSTHGFDIEFYILYSILCKLCILWIGVLDWHIHCARVWYEIIKIVEHSLDFHLRSCKRIDEVENVSDIFFDWYKILFLSFEICTMFLFRFVWWYTLMKNKHQISLYLGLKKNGLHFADNIFKWIFL